MVAHIGNDTNMFLKFFNSAYELKYSSLTIMGFGKKKSKNKTQRKLDLFLLAHLSGLALFRHVDSGLRHQLWKECFKSLCWFANGAY